MKTSIYISKDNESLFVRAKELSGDGLNAIITEAVRRHVALLEAQVSGMEEVTLEVGTWRRQGANDIRKVRLIGRLLADARVYHGQTSDQRDRWRDFKIYQTRAGKFVVSWYDGSLWEREDSSAGHSVLDRFPQRDALVEDEDGSGVYLPGSLLQEAAAALGRELVEWVE